MPKVLPEYLELRRHQILDAARDCFARNGFHTTSMQDICQASDLSPGAVYRYFHSKQDLIQAICDENCEANLRRIEAIKLLGDTAEVLRELAREFFQQAEAVKGGLDIELYAEARRTAEVKTALARGQEAIRHSFADFVHVAQERGDINPDLDPDSVARVLISTLLGLILQQELDEEIDVWKYVDVVLAMGSGTFWRGPSEADAQPVRSQRH